MYHYNGSNWSRVPISGFEGGNISGNFDYSGITGFSATDIWAAAGRPGEGKVIHFDGIEWNDVAIPEINHLLAIGGRSSTDLWAGALFGGLIHYDGTEWQSVELDLPLDDYHYPQFLSIESHDEIILSLFWAPSGSGSNRTFLMEYVDNKWVTADTTYGMGGGRLWISKSGTVYVTNGQILKWIDRDLIDDFPERPESVFMQKVRGPADDYLFAVGHDLNTFEAYVYHNNGNGWIRVNVPLIEPVWMDDIWTDGKKVFLIGTNLNSPFTTIIISGE